MDPMNQSDNEQTNQEQLSHYFLTSELYKFGDAYRDEHLLSLYEDLSKNKLFENAEDAMYVFACATGILWQSRLAPFVGINQLNQLFIENSLTDRQQRYILTRLIDYSNVAQQERHVNDTSTTITLEKVARLLTLEIDKLPAPTLIEQLSGFKSPFQLSTQKTTAKNDLIKIINTLYESNVIAARDYPQITKEEFISGVGLLFGVELSSPIKVSNAQKIDSPATTSSESKINIQPNCIEDLNSVLSPFFDANQQMDLSSILSGGQMAGENKLVFKASGIKLACLFKELKASDVIIGNQKAEVEEWLMRNFQYFDEKQKIVKDFTAQYLNGIISTNQKPCKSPIAIIKYKEGKIKIEPIASKTKNY